MSTGALPRLPFAAVLALLALAAGLLGGLPGERLLPVFGQGFGRQQGYLALLLGGSFFLAAVVGRGARLSLGPASVLLAPLCGAAMVCPDTAYAALAPLAGRWRRAIAVGAYAGFKLLPPAGPLLIAAGLGVDAGAPGFALAGLALLPPVVAVGLLWLRLAARPDSPPEEPAAGSAGQGPRAGLVRLLPLWLLLALLGAGLALGTAAPPWARLLLSPVGALLVTGLAAALPLPRAGRRECLESAVRRTAPLLLTIGAASALGAVLAEVLPLARLAGALGAGRGGLALLALLFGGAALFKLVNGSSLATFAAVPAVLAPLVAASALDRTGAAYAICLGSFVAVAPNDSFFWVSQPGGAAADGPGRERPLDLSVTGASVAQGLAGFLLLGAWLAASGRLG